MRRYRGHCGVGSTVQLITYSSHTLGGLGMGAMAYSEYLVWKQTICKLELQFPKLEVS